MDATSRTRDPSPQAPNVEPQTREPKPQTQVERSSPGPLRTLFPPLASHRQGYLQVSPLHSVYFEEFGNPKGQPALFLHGGPGAGCWPKHAQFFDPRHYRIVLLDQRGCGKSTPRGCLEDNTTQALVGDLEALREHLHVDRWLVLGGSWGATLALAYAQAYPGSVAGIILRGLCLFRRRDVSWVYRQGGGLDSLLPLAWRDFSAPLAPEELEDTVAAYYARLTSTDAPVREQAASAWMRLEMAAMFAGHPGSSPAQPHSVFSWDGTQYLLNGAPMSPQSGTPVAPQSGAPMPTQNGTPSSQQNAAPPSPSAAAAAAADAHSPPKDGAPSPGPISEPGGIGNGLPPSLQGQPPDRGAGRAQGAAPSNSPAQQPNGPPMPSSVAQARLECHYAHHCAFLGENELLEKIGPIRHIPTRVVHGRWDLVCPVKNALDLHEVWPQAELRIVSNAGHSMYDAGITHELVQATDDFKDRVSSQMSACPVL